MSHDLKSPLTSIRAYTEGLLDGVAKDEATRTRYLQTIYAKETELESLVNRLFAFGEARPPRGARASGAARSLRNVPGYCRRL